MRIRLLPLSAAAICSMATASIAVAQSGAYPRENDMTVERKAFTGVPFLKTGATMTDATGNDDVVVFDRGTGAPLPELVIDLSSVDLVPAADGWKATFRFTEPLPAEPTYPINFDLFVDIDGKTENNAKTGVFRAGTDRAFLLLFGTKTKWHTLTWQYDPASDRWAQLTTPVTFTIGTNDVSMSIPDALLPLEPARKSIVRAFALTSTGGVTAVDVAPGLALPAVRAPGEAATGGIGFAFNRTWTVLGLLVVLLGGSLWMAKRKQ